MNSIACLYKQRVSTCLHLIAYQEFKWGLILNEIIFNLQMVLGNICTIYACKTDKNYLILFLDNLI